MKKLAFALVMIFVISSLAVISSISFGVAQTPTSVIGIIFLDTTWTKANSPYNITGPAAVAKGVALTIQPGVTVNFNMFTFQVNGTLTAKGTSTDPITLNGGFHSRYPVFASEAHNGQLVFTDQSTGWNEQTGTGSIIQNVNIISLTITTSVTLKLDSNTFSGPYADDAVDVLSGSSTITNNFMNGSALGIGGGSPLVFNNTIEGFAPGGGLGLSISGGSPQILNNVFFQGNEGISIAGGTDITITNNIIANYSSGFSAGGFKELTLQGNLILYNNMAVSFGTYGASETIIQNNTIAFNKNAINAQGSSATIIYNNIENYAQKSITLSASGNLNAAYNWWGTTDTSAISQSIYDYKNDYNLGNVTFTPFLDAPNRQAPLISSFSVTNQLPVSSPTPSPSPTQSPTQTQNSTSPSPTQTTSTNPTATPIQPPQPTPTATPQNQTGSSALTQNQLYEVIAVLAAVIVGLIIAFVVVIHHKRTMK